MGTIKTDVLAGAVETDVIQIPTGVTNKYMQDLFNGNYGITIKPEDIIGKGPLLDPRVYGTTYDEVTLAAAINGVAGAEKTIILPEGTWTITGALTFPANICLFIPKGSKFLISAGASLSILGPVWAGPWQIFTGQGNRTLSDKTVLRYSEWEGTTGDYATFNEFPRLPYPEAPQRDDDAVTKGYVDGLLGSIPGQPTGIIYMFAGTAAPAGYLLCRGQTVKKADYPALAAVINSADWPYNSGGSIPADSFVIPDLRYRVPVGHSTGNELTQTLGLQGGEFAHQLTLAELPKHTHQYANAYYQGQSAPVGGPLNGARFSIGTTQSGDGLEDAPHNNMQPYLVVNYIIKT